MAVVASKVSIMTLHSSKSSREVGVRELHDHLSRYLRDVAQGGEVLVTMRGKRVARLSPIDAADPLAELRARGLIQEPSGPRRRGARSGIRPSEPVSPLVAEQRR